MRECLHHCFHMGCNCASQNFCGGLTKPLLTLAHGWIIAFYCFTRLQLRIYNLMLLQLISVNKVAIVHRGFYLFLAPPNPYKFYNYSPAITMGAMLYVYRTLISLVYINVLFTQKDMTCLYIFPEMLQANSDMLSIIGFHLTRCSQTKSITIYNIQRYIPFPAFLWLGNSGM